MAHTDPPAEQSAPAKRKRGNPTGRNQWTKLHEAKRRGLVNGIKAEQTWRERYTAEALATPLAEHVAGRKRLRPTQIKAAEILLDRLEPRLSAVEQQISNPDDSKSPQQLLEELKPLLLAHPEWLRALGFVPVAPQDTEQKVA